MLRREFLGATPFIADQANSAFEAGVCGGIPYWMRDKYSWDALKTDLSLRGFIDLPRALARARAAIDEGWFDIGVWGGHKKPLSRSALVGTNPNTGMVEFLPVSEAESKA